MVLDSRTGGPANLTMTEAPPEKPGDSRGRFRSPRFKIPFQIQPSVLLRLGAFPPVAAVLTGWLSSTLSKAPLNLKADAQAGKPVVKGCREVGIVSGLW